MSTVNIHEAKTQFSRIVEQVEAGEEVVIARAGKPVARLMPLESAVPKARKLGQGKKRFTFPSNFDNLNAGEITSMFEPGK
jgi:prevent-host-death family protein